MGKNLLEYAYKNKRDKKSEEAANASSSANKANGKTNLIEYAYSTPKAEETNNNRANVIPEKINTKVSPARNATYTWMQEVEKQTDGLTSALSKGVNGNLNNLKNITSYTNTVDSLLRSGHNALQIAKGTSDYDSVRKYYSYLQDLKKGIDYYKEGNDIFKLTDTEYKVGKALDNNGTNSLEYAADSPNPLWFKNKEAQRDHENYYKISDEDIEKYNDKEFKLTMKFAGDNYKNTDTYKSAVNDLKKKGMTDKEAANMLDRIMNDPESIKRKKIDDKLTRFSEEEIRHYTSPDFRNALSTPEGDKSYFYNQAIDEIKAKGFSEEEAEKIIYRFSEMANDVDKDINRRAGERRANRQNVLENLMDDVAGTPIKSAEGLWNIAKGTARLIPGTKENEIIAPKDDGGYATYLNAMHEATTGDMGVVGKTAYNTSKLLGDLGLMYLIGGPAVENVEKGGEAFYALENGKVAKYITPKSVVQLKSKMHPVTVAGLFGGSAADDAYVNAKNNGVSEERALTYAVAQGISSYLVMKVGLGNLSKMTKNQLINTMVQSSGNMMAMSTAGQLADLFEQQAILGKNSTLNKSYQAYLDQGMSEANAQKKIAQDLGIQLGTGLIEGMVTGAVLGAGAYGKGIITGEINDSVSENQEKQITPEDTEYFKGVKNTEELKSKWRELAKTYHSDQATGNEEAIKQINLEHEELVKYFESNPATKGRLSEALTKLKNFKERILNFRSSSPAETNTEIALLQDSKMSEMVAAVDNKINEVEAAIKNAPAESSETTPGQSSEVMVPETNDIIYMPPTEDKVNAPLQKENANDITNIPSQEEKIRDIANTLPQDNLRAAAMEMNGVSKSEIPALKNAAMEMNGANTDLKNVAKNEVTSKSVNRLKDAPDINVGNNKTKGLKVEKTLDETAGNTPQVTETKVPDAIKLKGKEIIDSVRNGSYKPKYELGHNVDTDYGKGYIQEVIRTDGETMDVIVNFENGQSEVMRFEDYDDYFALTDEGADELYASAAAVGYEGANLMIKEANPKLLENPSALMRYVKDFYKLYNAGKRGTSFKDIYESGYELYMPEKKAMKIYKAGVTDALYELKAKKENLKVKEETEINQKETSKAEIESKNIEPKQLRDAEIDIRNADYYKNREIPQDKVEERAMSSQHKAEIEAVENISKATGIPIKFYDSTIDKNGNYVGANGFFDKETNTIWLDINAGKKNAETVNTAIIATLSHELVHFGKLHAGDFYKKYADSVFKALMKQTGKARNELIDEMMKKLGTNNRSEAEEEVVAYGSEEMLKGSKAFDKIAEENKGFFEQIKEHIKELLDKIKNAIKKAYEGYKPASEEAKILHKAEEFAEELQNKYDDMLVESVKNYNVEAKEPGMKLSFDNVKEILKKINKEVNDRNGNNWVEIGQLPLSTTSLLGVDPLQIAIMRRHTYIVMSDEETAYKDNKIKILSRDNFHSKGVDGLAKDIMKLEHPIMIFDAGGKTEIKLGYVLDTKDNGDWTVAYINLYRKKNVNNKYLDVHALMTLFDKDNITDEFKMNAVNNQLFVDTNKIASLPLNERRQSPNIVTKLATSEKNIRIFKEKVNRLLENNKKNNFSFAGRESATADLSMLNKAKQMEKTGATKEDILDKTGWFKGVDGKWRYEIDNSDIKLKELSKIDYYQPVELQDVIEDNKVFKAYPELKELPVFLMKDDGITAGRYQGLGTLGEMERIELSDYYFRDGSKYVSKKMTELEKQINNIKKELTEKEDNDLWTFEYLVGFMDGELYDTFSPEKKEEYENKIDKFWDEYGDNDKIKKILDLKDDLKYETNEVKRKKVVTDKEGLKSTIVHEIQHYIQNKEGFERGASPEFWKSVVNNDLAALGKSEINEVKKREEELYSFEMTLKEKYSPDIIKKIDEYSYMDNTYNKAILSDKMNPEVFKQLEKDYFRISDELEKIGGENAVEDADKLIKLKDNIMRFHDYVEKRNARSAKDLYMNTVGEIEARDVQDRLKNKSGFPKVGEKTPDMVSSGKANNSQFLFSMRNDVEETDKFVATHNLGIDNLKEMLKLGGFPMPSIAVTKSKVGNKGFGGVSVVFRKNTIDPAANSNNKLYSGDAWTPVFPNTEWKLNEKGVKKLADKLDTSSGYLEQFIEKPDRAVEKLKEERMTKEAFLKEQNVTIEKKKMNKPYSSDSMKKIEDVVRKKQYTIDKIVNSDEIQEELAQLLRPIDKDSRQFLVKWHNDIKEDLKRLNEADEFDKPLLQMKEDIESMLSGKREQVFDSESYDNDVDAYLKEHDEEYTKYITDALEGVYEDKYLVKPGVEPYYSDGSRKSFNQLHLPYSIENIVSIMKGQDKGKGGGVLWGGASSLKGAGTKEFGTVEEMKQNAGKIKETSDEEIREVYREMNERIDNIINTTLETNGRDSSSWMAKDGFAEIMTEAFAKKRFTENTIRNYFKKEMGLEVTHEIFEEMKSLKNDLEAIPVKYFEAKPERAVGLDEVAYVVIPDTTPAKDKEEIASYGIQYKEYKEGDEESRIAAVNSDPEVMFSMRNVSDESYEELLEENENLKKQVAALEKQFKVTNGFSPKESDIRTVGNKIIKAYSSDYPINDFMENMKQIVDYTAKNKNANYGLVMEAMMKIAGEIANQSTYKDSSLYDQYSNLRKSMRSTTIRLTKKQIEEVEYKYGSFNDFRKANFGKLKFSDKKGIYLDEYWKENAQLYPDMFMEDVNEGDMANELVGIYDDIRQPVLIKGSEMDMKYATTEIAQDIFKEYFDLPSVQTFADARIHELNDARDEYRQLVNEQRQEFNDKYNKKVYRDKIKRVRNNIAQKVTVKKSVPLDMVDKVIDVCNEIYLGGVNVAAVGRKTAAELNSKLNIPKDKAKKISDMCETLFFDNPNESVGRTEDRLIKWLSEGEFKGLQIRDIADICHDNFFAMAATNKVEKGLHSRLKNLQQTYAKYEKLPETEYEWKSEYNERLNSKLEEIVEITQDKAINSLNAYELDKVYQALQEVAHIIINADRQIGEEENRKNQEIAREIVTEVKNSNTRKSKLSRYVNTYNDKLVLNSTRYMRAITNWNPESPLYNKVFKPVFEAQRVKDMNVMKMKKPFDKLVDDKKNFDLYTGRDKKGIIKNVLTDIKGNPVDMSLDQICTLLMTWERKRGEAHAEVGGIKIDDIYLLNKGKKRKAYDEGAVIPRLNQQTIEHLKKIVSDYSKEWMKKGHILLNEVTTDMINETSIQSRGVPIATAKNYFPLKVVGNYIKNESPAMKHDATIEGMGMLKETKSGAKQMLYIKPLTSIVDETIENVARYNAFTIPLRNARKLMNYIFYDENESVQNAIEEQYGSFAKEKMVRILDEIETGKNLLKPSNSEEWGKLYSNFVAAALNTNLSVSIKQFASYPTAQAYIKGKYLMRALLHPVDYDEIDEYTGAHYKRRQGLSHIELDNIRKSSKLQNVFDKLPTVLNGRKWITMMDCFTTSKLFYAAKLQIEAEGKYKEGSKEFKKAVADLYNKVLEETQPMYDVQYRADVQKKPGWEVIAMFKTQPLQTYGMLYDATGEYEFAKSKAKQDREYKKSEEYKQAKKRMYFARKAFLNSSILFTALTAFANMVMKKDSQWRDKETGEVDLIKTVPIHLLENYIGNRFPILGGEIFGWVTGTYNDLETPTLSMINESYHASNNLIKYVMDCKQGKKEFERSELNKKIENIAYDLSSIAGVEAKNIANIIKAGIYWVGYATDNKQIINSYGYQYKDAQLYNQLYNAIVEGDEEKQNSLQQYFIDEGKSSKDIDNKLKQMYAENDPRVLDAAEAYNSGDFSEYETLIDEMSETGMKKDIIIAAVKYAAGKISKGVSEDVPESEYDSSDEQKPLYKQADLYSAVKSGDVNSFNKVKKEILASGKDDKYIESSLKKGIKTDYDNGEITMSQAKKYMKDYLGYSDLKVYETECNWNDKNIYEDLGEAVKSGSQKNMNYYMELLYNKGNGKKIDTIKDGINSQVRGNLTYNYYSGGDTATIYNSLMYAADYMGLDKDKYIDSINDWVSGGNDYSNLMSYVAAGNTSSAKREILYLNADKKKQVATIEGKIKNVFKPVYLYMKENNKNTETLKNTIVELATYMGIPDYDKEIESW